MDYSNSNYGLNALKIEIDRLTLWFSYKTIIAFDYDGYFCIRENDWNNTTGKHLNAINVVKENRLSSEEFNKNLDISLLNIKLDKDIVDCSKYE
jgi:hypothetical protein